MNAKVKVFAVAAICLLSVSTGDGYFLGMQFAHPFMFGAVPRFFNSPGNLNVMGHSLNVGRPWFGRPEPGYGAHPEPDYGPSAEPGFPVHAEPSYDTQGHYPMYAGFKK